MASRGTPLYQQVGQYGHKIGKAPLYYWNNTTTTVAITANQTHGNYFNYRAADVTIDLHKYDVFAFGNAGGVSGALASGSVCQLLVPTASALAQNLPKRPEVGDYFEFSITSSIGTTNVTTKAVIGQILFPTATSSSTGGWQRRLGVRSAVQLTRRGNTKQGEDDLSPISCRFRCVWVNVTPGSEKLDYFVVG